MLAKVWKKICVLILIIACLFNITLKLVKRVSFNKEAVFSAKYMIEQYKYEKDDENVIKQYLKFSLKYDNIEYNVQAKAKHERRGEYKNE